MGVAKVVELDLGLVLELRQIDFPIFFLGDGVMCGLGGGQGGGHNFQKGGQLK